MLPTLFRANALIKAFVQWFGSTKITLPLALSIGSTRVLLCDIFIFYVFLPFSVASLVQKGLIFSPIVDIVVTPCLLHQNWIQDSILVTIPSLAYPYLEVLFSRYF